MTIRFKHYMLIESVTSDEALTLDEISRKPGIRYLYSTPQSVRNILGYLVQAGLIDRSGSGWIATKNGVQSCEDFRRKMSGVVRRLSDSELTHI